MNKTCKYKATSQGIAELTSVGILQHELPDLSMFIEHKVKNTIVQVPFDSVGKYLPVSEKRDRYR